MDKENVVCVCVFVCVYTHTYIQWTITQSQKE